MSIRPPHYTPLAQRCSAPVPFRLAKRFLLDLTDFGSCRYNLQSSAQKPTSKRKRQAGRGGEGGAAKREKKLVIKWKAKWNGRRTQVQEGAQQLVAPRIHEEAWSGAGRRSCLPVARDACDFLWDGDWQLATGDWRFLWHPHPQREIIIATAFLSAWVLQLFSNRMWYICVQSIYS